MMYAVFKVRSYGSSLRSFGGDKEIRTLDPLLARQVLSQLSYAPISFCLSFSVVCFFLVSSCLSSLSFESSLSKLNSKFFSLERR